MELLAITTAIGLYFIERVKRQDAETGLLDNYWHTKRVQRPQYQGIAS